MKCVWNDMNQIRTKIKRISFYTPGGPISYWFDKKYKIKFDKYSCYTDKSVLKLLALYTIVKHTYSMWGLTPGLCGLCGASAIPSSCRLRIFRYFWQKGLENNCLGFNVQPCRWILIKQIFYLRNHRDHLSRL